MFYNWLNIYLKTLLSVRKERNKKIGFRGHKGSTGSTGWGTDRPVVLVRSRTSRGMPKTFFLSQWPSLPGRSDSLPCRGPVESTVTCQALNALMASEPDEVTFCCFWLPSLETYKLRAPLHLLIREHLHSIVYLPVLDQKALISFIMH